MVEEKFDFAGFERLKAAFDASYVHQEVACQPNTKRYIIAKKLERFLSSFLTCQRRKNGFCHNHVHVCLCCLKVRQLLATGRRSHHCIFWVNTKYGTYYFYFLKKLGLRNFAFLVSNKST